jgi:hypothetical protein
MFPKNTHYRDFHNQKMVINNLSQPENAILLVMTNFSRIVNGGFLYMTNFSCIGIGVFYT